jgi:hypothetical protein
MGCAIIPVCVAECAQLFASAVSRSFVGVDGEPLFTEKSAVKTRAQSRSDPGGGLSLRQSHALPT